MPSARSTQPRLVTEPTTNPTLAPPRHSSTPTCTRCTCCALAPPIEETSVANAAAARMRERRMKKSPAEKLGCEQKIKNNAVPPALTVLCHNITGGARIRRHSGGDAQHRTRNDDRVK